MRRTSRGGRRPFDGCLPLFRAPRYCDGPPPRAAGLKSRKIRVVSEKIFSGTFVSGCQLQEENYMATARKSKAEETPGYCKTEDLANLCVLTGQWINQLTRDGVIKRRDTPA